MTSMTHQSSASTSDGIRITWRAVGQALTRPYPVTLPMVLLVGMIPFYLVIARRAGTNAAEAPALVLDGLLPLQPAWALVYGALYAFLIVLPVLVVQEQELIRRTVWAYLTVWTVAYICFLAYPTVAPRPDTVPGDGFAVWGLRFLYNADPPYNCLPSIHVAHSFVSALACGRVHRTLGVAALSCASLVALSTLFTKQHYVLDLVAGILLALVAHLIFLHGYPRANIAEAERRVAPALALAVGGVVAVGLACFWVAYRLGVGA
jgi:membrane-associated phospholipid phosphatase